VCYSVTGRVLQFSVSFTVPLLLINQIPFCFKRSTRIYLNSILWCVRIDNRTFERVEEFKYFGTTLTNQNYIAEEIKSRLRSGNACYHSVQNLLSSRLLSKNLKIKIYIEL